MLFELRDLAPGYIDRVAAAPLYRGLSIPDRMRLDPQGELVDVDRGPVAECMGPALLHSLSQIPGTEVSLPVADPGTKKVCRRQPDQARFPHRPLRS